MITDTKMVELTQRAREILTVAFERGHLGWNETLLLASPVMAVILQKLIQDEENRACMVPIGRIALNSHE